MVVSDRIKDLVNLAAVAAASKLGTEIVAIDVSARLPLSDVFLIVSAKNERQVLAIADGIEEALLVEKVKTRRIEGRDLSRWVLLDFTDFIVHIFHEEDREYYALERLWSDSPVLDLDLAALDNK